MLLSYLIGMCHRLDLFFFFNFLHFMWLYYQLNKLVLSNYW